MLLTLVWKWSTEKKKKTTHKQQIGGWWCLSDSQCKQMNGQYNKMAEWSIHVVCCDVIVEDGQHHWPFTLLLLLQYNYYYNHWLYNNSSSLCAVEINTSSHVKHSTAPLKESAMSHVRLFLVGSAPAECAPVWLYLSMNVNVEMHCIEFG